MDHQHEPDRAVRDIVCGMLLSEKTAVTACEHGGQMLYFCCDLCQEAFEADPGRYLARRRRWARRRGQAAAT